MAALELDSAVLIRTNIGGGVDTVLIVVGAVGGLLTLILSAIALVQRVLNGLRAVVLDVLVDTGMIKPGKRSEIWPNGSDNLPDFLMSLYEMASRNVDSD